jgi:hypothetical protein
MASLLDLPPELIHLIIMHLQGPERSALPGTRIRNRPRVATGTQLVCPCYDAENIMKQLLTRAGTDPGEEGENVVRFGTSHSFIEDCVIESRICEMVDVMAVVIRGKGLMALPPSRTVIPSAVRYVNLHSGENHN